MNEIVKDIVDFIDGNHPTMCSTDGVTEIAPGVYRAEIGDRRGDVEVEFRVKR